jgi:hypothetical protein
LPAGDKRTGIEPPGKIEHPVIDIPGAGRARLVMTMRNARSAADLVAPAGGPTSGRTHDIRSCERIRVACTARGVRAIIGSMWWLELAGVIAFAVLLIGAGVVTARQPKGNRAVVPWLVLGAVVLAVGVYALVMTS